MRKATLILLGLFCCLLATAGGGGVRQMGVPKAVAVLSIDQASDNQWRCERAYNSDLGVPRLCAEVSSVAAPSSPRTIASESARVHARYLAARHDVVLQGLLLGYCALSFDPSSGPHPVDHYVYRLRRLII